MSRQSSPDPDRYEKLVRCLCAAAMAGLGLWMLWAVAE